MNRSVKVFAGLMSLIFVFALFPMAKTRVNAYTDTHGFCGKGADTICWTYSPELGMLIISGRGEMQDFYEGTAPWYCWKNEIKEVRIYDDVTSIGQYSFANCEKMENVWISSSVESIRAGAFRCCRSLSTVEIPDTVTSIGYGAFFSCGLTSVKLSKNISEIPGRAFYNSIYLTSVFIPEKVDSIGEDAFSWSPRLKTVEYEGYPSFVDATAFSNCDPEITITSPRMIFYTSDGHGTVSGKDHAKFGENVELVVSADFGYDVDRVWFSRNGGQDCRDIHSDPQGNYSFRMPDSDTPVTVYVEFVAWEPEPEPDPTPTPSSTKKVEDPPKKQGGGASAFYYLLHEDFVVRASGSYAAIGKARVESLFSASDLVMLVSIKLTSDVTFTTGNGKKVTLPKGTTWALSAPAIRDGRKVTLSFIRSESPESAASIVKKYKLESMTGKMHVDRQKSKPLFWKLDCFGCGFYFRYT